MENNNYLKESQQGRPRLLEFLLVLTVVGLLIFIAVHFYQEPIERSKSSMVEFHSGVFSRMASNLHAVAKTATYAGTIPLQNQLVFLNEHDWPANTDPNLSPLSKNQTVEGCRQLWNAFFSNAPSSSIAGGKDLNQSNYIISLRNNTICRYKFARKQEGSNFFDYDVISGAVTVVHPK
ncbi:MAG: Tfp pilus assembly protein PilE [Lentisphaeria bacterium]|jgi:Tfp pilus assembly protein PilE